MQRWKELPDKILALLKQTQEPVCILLSKKDCNALRNVGLTTMLGGYPSMIFGVPFVVVEKLNQSPQLIYKVPELNFKGYAVLKGDN